MRTIAAAVLLAVASAAVAGGSFLAKVDRASGLDGARLARQGFDVVAELEEVILVRATGDELDGLVLEFGAELVDRDPESRLYLYVMPRSGFPLDRLPAYGRVLLEDGSGALLATSEDRILELNRLPVELARIRMRPLVLDQRDGGLPPLPTVDD